MKINNFFLSLLLFLSLDSFCLKLFLKNKKEDIFFNDQKYVCSQEKTVFDACTLIALSGAMVGGVCWLARNEYKLYFFKKRMKKILQKTELKKLVNSFFVSYGHLFQVYNLIDSAENIVNTGCSQKMGFSIELTNGGGFCNTAMIQLKERLYAAIYKLIFDLKAYPEFLSIIHKIEETSFVSFSVETVLFEILKDTNFMLIL